MNFDISYKYGTVYRFLLFTAGIACLFPLSIFICFLAISSFYWFDKYLLLNRYTISQKQGSKIILKNQSIMGQFPIYLATTNLIIMFIPIIDGKAF